MPSAGGQVEGTGMLVPHDPSPVGRELEQGLPSEVPIPHPPLVMQTWTPWQAGSLATSWIVPGKLGRWHAG